jgi:hypothetical protein
MSAAERSDVLILGATPGGIAAAIAAARLGHRVLVLERSSHIGGLPANGLGITDIQTREATGGVFKEFIQRIKVHYVSTYGNDSQQVADCSDGYRFEPHIAEAAIESMVAETPGIEVLRRRQFDADAANVTIRSNRLREACVINLETGTTESYGADVFVDATYEGDLAAAAGAPYRVGREGRDEYGEPCAGRVYWSWDSGELLEGSTGEADRAVQAYNYRFCLTKDPALRVPIIRPKDYRRDDYVSIKRDVADGRLQHGIYRYPRAACAKPVPIPNGKFDTNDHPKALISTDLPEENWSYPEADWAWRDRFAQRLREYELGLIWFCQHDSSLPEGFRKDALEWGLAGDEYVDNNFFPRQLYVREGRRIMGEYLFTALDCIPPLDVPKALDILAGRDEPSENERPPHHADSITAAHYPLDSHACRKREPGRTQLDGYFALGRITRPYQVPYRVIIPKRVEGLLTPVPCSATHLGFGTLRMEPCWMALGQAAGVAAHLAASNDTVPRGVSVEKLQSILIEQRAVLTFLRDVPADHPSFAALQWAALKGLFPGYDAEPGRRVERGEAIRWTSELGIADLPKPMLDGKITRAVFFERCRRIAE